MRILFLHPPSPTIKKHAKIHVGVVSVVDENRKYLDKKIIYSVFALASWGCSR